MSKVANNGHRVPVLEAGIKEHVSGTHFSGRDEEPEATRSGRKNGVEPVAPTDTSRRARRRFTLKDKERILRLADACTDQAQVGALLRREGIYKCTLERFITERAGATLAADVVRSRKSIGEQETEDLRRQVALLERQNSSLNAKLKKAEIVIDFQKKLSQLLGLEMQDPEPLGSMKP